MPLASSHNSRSFIGDDDSIVRDGRSEVPTLLERWATTYSHHTPTGSPDLVWWARCLDRFTPNSQPVGATTIQVAA